MTAEDPVEFQLGGVNQVQMKEQIGVELCGFPATLFCGKIRTSFWLAKFETLKRRKLLSRRL